MKVEQENVLLVDTPTAAKMLGVSSRTVWSLANSGELRRVTIGRSVRFAVAELERYIAAKMEGGAK